MTTTERSAYYEAEIRKLVTQRNHIKTDLRDRQTTCEQGLLVLFARIDALMLRIDRLESRTD